MNEAEEEYNKSGRNNSAHNNDVAGGAGRRASQKLNERVSLLLRGNFATLRSVYTSRAWSTPRLPFLSLLETRGVVALVSVYSCPFCLFAALICNFLCIYSWFVSCCRKFLHRWLVTIKAAVLQRHE